MQEQKSALPTIANRAKKGGEQNERKFEECKKSRWAYTAGFS